MALTPSQKNKKNYDYGKLVDGVITYAPYYLVIGKKCYINAKRETYLSQGWKKIIVGEMPESETEVEYKEVLSEDTEYIYDNWVIAETSEDTEQ